MSWKLRIGFSWLLILVILLGFSSGDLLGETYPNKPIRIIVPFAAGGAADLFARIVGQGLTKKWGQPVVVDNRPGGNGFIGAQLAAKSPADGYTIYMGNSDHLTINPALFTKVPYDTVKDFAPVTPVAYQKFLLIVHPAIAAASVKELIALAKSKPGQLNFASWGDGSMSHLAGEIFKTMAQVDMVHIPYKGSAPALTDLLGGHVSLMFASIGTGMPHVTSGKVRVLAVSSAKRSPVLPEVPTVEESGFPGFDIQSWNGVLVPAATPREIVTQLNTEIVKILDLPDVKERLSKLGVEPAGRTPEQFAAIIKADLVKWAKFAKDSKIRLD